MIEKLPEQWCVRVEEDNTPIEVYEWRAIKNKWGGWLNYAGYIDEKFYHTVDKPDNRIEISLNDFKKLVLGENISENYDYLIKLLKTLKIK